MGAADPTGVVPLGTTPAPAGVVQPPALPPLPDLPPPEPALGDDDQGGAAAHLAEPASAHADGVGAAQTEYAVSGSLAAKLRAKIEASQAGRTKKFLVPTLEDNPTARFVVEVRAPGANESLADGAKSDARFIAKVTTAVYGIEGDVDDDADIDDVEMELIPGGWKTVGKIMGVPANFKPHQIVVLVCENNKVLISGLNVEIVSWMSGQRKQDQTDMG